MKKLFILPFILLSLTVFAGCSDNSVPTSKPPASNTQAHDDTGQVPHGHDEAVVDDHHKGETNVAPHDETGTGTVVHDDSGLPPHRD